MGVLYCTVEGFALVRSASDRISWSVVPKHRLNLPIRSRWTTLTGLKGPNWRLCVCVHEWSVWVVAVCTYRDDSNSLMLYSSASSQRHNSRPARIRWYIRRRPRILSGDSCVKCLVYRALPLSYITCHCTHKLLGSVHTHCDGNPIWTVK